jgi:hypothetical protein
MRYRVEGAKKTTTAFALAGLGGFNAHGAGFLAAASDCGVVPNLVTATSGQIVVLADWLQGDNLEKLLIDPELEHNALAQLAVTLSGDPGVFRPAYLEAIKRWWTPPWGNSLAEGLFNRLFPAQLYVPTRKPADFTTIARVFNDEAKARREASALTCRRRCSPLPMRSLNNETPRLHHASRRRGRMAACGAGAAAGDAGNRFS